MSKNCKENHCKEASTFQCQTCEPSDFFCSNHAESHVLISAGHNVVLLAKKLTDSEKYELIDKIFEIERGIKEVRLDLAKVAEKIIAIVTNKYFETDLKLINIEKMCTELHQKILTNKKVNKNTYEYINSLNIIENSKLPTKNLSETIKQNLDIKNFLISYTETQENYKKALFSKNNQLFMIDLNTFKCKNLNFAPQVTQYFQMCKISKDSYFIN